MKPFRAHTFFDPAGPGRRDRLSGKTPPGLFLVQRDQIVGQFSPLRDLGDQKTFIPRSDHDATEIEGQSKKRRAGTDLHRLGAKNSTFRRCEPFEDFETRKRGHRPSLH